MRKKILDHGYLTLVEHWGDDTRIIEAARMSTGKGFLGWGPNCPYAKTPDEQVAHDLRRTDHIYCAICGPVAPKPGDEKLLRYLWENKHATPFEMVGATFEIQAPIFVFREWHRHRTQSYNELSARYTPLPDLNYVPTVERLMMTSTSNKQAQGTGTVLTQDGALEFRDRLMGSYAEQEHQYQHALASGIPKELARLIIPVGRYSRMRASANLRNWLAFLTLRMAPNAQWEIRQYANALHDMLAGVFPRTLALFDKVRIVTNAALG